MRHRAHDRALVERYVRSYYGWVARMLRLAVQASIVSTLVVGLVASAKADSKMAQAHYAEGLERVQQGRLAEALEAFQRAYDESPHYAVLLNLSRVARDLGQQAESIAYLKRYLVEGGDRIPAAARRRAEQEIAEASGKAAENEPADESVVQAGAGETPSRTGIEPELLTPASPPAPSSPATTGPAASPPLPVTLLRPAPRQPRSNEQRAWRVGFAAGLGGAAGSVLLASVAVKWWNHGRYTEWRDRHEQLAHELQSPAAAEAPSDYDYRIGRDAAEIEAIRRVDAITWVSAGAGAVMLASAVALWWSLPEKVSLHAGLNGAEVHVAF